MEGADGAVGLGADARVDSAVGELLRCGERGDARRWGDVAGGGAFLLVALAAIRHLAVVLLPPRLQ